MNPPLNAIQATRRQSFLRRLAALSVWLLVSGAPVSGQVAEVHLADDSLLTATSSPAPTRRLPVLFVHGHNETNQDTDFNYRKNWQQQLRGLSFKQVLEANSGLGIEPYYIRFVDQGRSITEDAAEIGNAIERILHRHDPDYPTVRSTTHVQVVIIAYSKGTISTRLYLKNLEAEGRGFRPISEFIAISPPNHGITTPVFALTPTQSLAVKQLYNGTRPNTLSYDCTDSFNEPSATNYISILNGHDIAHSISLEPNEFYPEEAPGSRADGSPTTAGTLYVTLFASGNRDFVGGAIPSTDCPQNDGRKLALNMAQDAINSPLVEITDAGWENIRQVLGIPTDSQRRAVAVHQNTVHTSEVICQALYAAVHHRSPLNQTCTPDTNGIPIIPPPPRAAAMLTLDFSGSMSAAACPGCPTRAVVLKDAVELFVQLWSTVSVPSDRIGVNYFNTNVTPSAINGGVPALLSGGTANLIAEVVSQSPGGMTAMGGALQQAIQTLNGVSADTQIRRVILFTDGIQNVNPMVTPSPNPMVPSGRQLVIANEPGRQNSNVTPAVPPTVLDISHGIAVDTIGIGDDVPLVGLLNEIASDTGGHTLVTTAPNDDLRRFFVEELINALRGFSPQLVAYRRASIGSAGSNIETFAVEGGPRRVVLKLSWKRGETMDLSVKKDGVDVTAAGRFISGEFYKIFVIDLPKNGKSPIAARGNWQVRVKGKATTAYEAAAIVDGGRITYDTVFNAKRPTVGSPFDLVVRSTVGGKPIAANARVTATLMIPTTTARDLIAANPPKEPPVFEPGMTLFERQLLALEQDPKAWAKLKPRRQTVVLKQGRNGAFSTRLRPQVPGIYTAVVTIEGEAAKIGKFSRTMTATTVVRPPEPRK